MSSEHKIAVPKIIKIVKEYLSGKISLREAASKGGVSSVAVKEWIRNYEVFGTEAFQPGQRVYAPELKINAVKDYLAGAGSRSEICRKYHIRASSALNNWIRVYNAHGDFYSRKNSGGGSYMKQCRSTTQEERIQIAKDCLESGKNYGAAALKYNVSYQQARTWALRFEELGEAGLEDRRGRRKKDQTPRTELEKMQIENDQLRHRLYMAEMERDLLKKLDEIERRNAFRR